MIHPCDRQTEVLDGQTEGRAIAYSALNICYMLSRAKKRYSRLPKQSSFPLWKQQSMSLIDGDVSNIGMCFRNRRKLVFSALCSAFSHIGNKLTIRRPLLPYGHSCKTSCARPG